MGPCACVVNRAERAPRSLVNAMTWPVSAVAQNR